MLEDQAGKFAEANEETKEKENQLMVLKNNLLKRLRKYESKETVQKLESWRWNRTYSGVEIMNELNLVTDKEDMKYREELGTKGVYYKKNAMERVNQVYTETRMRLVAKMEDPSDLIPEEIGFLGKDLSADEIKKRLLYFSLQMDITLEDFRNYKNYLTKYRMKSDQDTSEIDKLGLTSERKASDLSNLSNSLKKTTIELASQEFHSTTTPTQSSIKNIIKIDFSLSPSFLSMFDHASKPPRRLETKKPRHRILASGKLGMSFRKRLNARKLEIFGNEMAVEFVKDAKLDIGEIIIDGKSGFSPVLIKKDEV